jgi:hypothetical protein
VPEDLVFVPRIGFRSVHALGTRANVIAKKDGRTLTAAITPDRDGIRLQFTVTGIPMELDSNGKRFEDPVEIHDDKGRDISTPRPRWQVGGSFARASDGTASLSYTTLLEPLAPDVRAVELALRGAAGEWAVSVPVEPEGFMGAPARALNASDTQRGVTVAARLIARSELETAVELEAYFEPPEPIQDGQRAKRWVRGIGCSMGGAPMSGHPMRERLALRDGAGREHRELGQSFIDPVARRHREVVTFPAMDGDLGLLEVPDVWIQEMTDETVTLRVPGDADISIAGCEAHIAASRVGGSADSIRVEVTPRNADGARELLYLESVVVPGGDPRGTIGMGITQCIGQRPYLTLPDPTAKVHEVMLRSPVVRLRGPWTLELALA